MKALITGASSGMGRDMANYLASFGYDLIVVAKDKEKLEETFKNIRTKVECIALDLSKEENVKKLYDMNKGKNIDLLINNVGFGDCGSFISTSLEKELDMINVNIKCNHILTKLFLKDFTKRNRGRILNVASISGFFPGPYMATYYGTKAYILNLTLAIYKELKGMNSNVKISVFCPGPVRTNFNNVANVKFNLNSISSDFASKYAIDNMFMNKLIIIPKLSMKLSRILGKISPIKLTLAITSKIQTKNK